MRTVKPSGKAERGQTIILVALSMVTLLALAALAIDVVTLYVARSEAQRVAEAAALAGAKAFVTSGYTSYPAGFATTSGLCTGTGTGLAEQQAQAAANQNNIGGVSPTIMWSGSACNFNQPENPQITIQVQRTGLPLFFARIWNTAAPTVTATATAEAYNPSYNPSSGVIPPPIQVSAVKPWLVPNCPPSGGPPPNANCTAANVYFLNSDGSIATNYAFLGSTITLQLPSNSGALPAVTNPPGSAPNAQLPFYPLDIPINPPTPFCPSSTMPSCSLVGNGPYFDNIACSNSLQFVPGQYVGASTSSVPVDSRLGQTGSPWGQLQSRTDQGAQCRIHSSTSTGLVAGCSPGLYEQDCFTPQGAGEPILISPGYNNPNPSMLSASYIGRSDSVVTIPLFDGSNLCPLGANNPCTVSAPIIGFLQLGIMSDVGNGTVQAIILNASGWNSSSTGTAVSGGDVTPLPVRLVQ